MLKSEIETLKSADHPNIVRLYEVYEDDKYLHFVMDLCTGGDLLDHLMSNGPLSESKAADYMRKLLQAVNHLHSLNICHRDLKPENFLLSSRGRDAEIKIVDFGMSVKFGDKDMETAVGTPYFLAPEILRGTYGKECDI